MISQGNAYYAALINLQGEQCVVIGGGKVAERKMEKLVSCKAKVRVVSPEIEPQIQAWVDEGRVEHLAREYVTGDVSDAVLVFAATNNRHVNQSIYEEAKQLGKLVNVVDHAQSCSFIVPATYHQGSLQIAISTSGENPSKAKRLKAGLENDLQSGTNNFMDEIRNQDGRS